MMLTLMVSLLASAPAPPERVADAIRSDDPPIKLSLNQDNYFHRGDRARVKVRTAEDGYVVVLRSDAQGRVRVLFPLDPTGDDFVRGGRTLEVRGRGDREAFYVDDADGAGLVLAARSAAPFKFDEFVRGDHWDYRVLTVREAGDDKEQALLDIAQRMTPDGHFDYDVAHYTVASVDSYYSGYNHYYSPFGMRVGFGYGYGYGSPYYRYGGHSSCYDPFFYRPVFCGGGLFHPVFFPPFGPPACGIPGATPQSPAQLTGWRPRRARAASPPSGGRRKRNHPRGGMPGARIGPVAVAAAAAASGGVVAEAGVEVAVPERAAV